MSDHSTVSAWADAYEATSRSELKEDLRADVCVIGAGIAGLTTALLLSREKYRVAVLDRGLVGGGETSHSTAHLSNALDDHYFKIEDLHGRDWSRRAQESHAAAIDCIESICMQEAIDCEFTRLDGYLFTPTGDSARILERELPASQRAGLTGVERLNRAPLESFDTGPCLRFPNQAQFHPIKYINGLARAVERAGGRIYVKSPVVKVHGDRDPHVRTEKGKTVTAGTIVVATNTPIHDNLTIHSRQAPYRTYAIGARIHWDAIPRALYWDTSDPYHYVRLKSDHTPEDKQGRDMLIVGGADHKQGKADDGGDRFRWLEEWTRRRFPIGEVDYRWSGMVMEPADNLGFIGADSTSENIFMGTGDSGHGMTHGTLAGMILTDLIAGRQNRWAQLYDPRRVTARAMPEYVSDSVDVVRELLEWVTPGEVPSSSHIGPSSGAIVRRGLGKMAVYRREDGSLHECSAICPHLGCVVAWNSTEHGWDCPCHGSRFDALGRSLSGPAKSDLSTSE